MKPGWFRALSALALLAVAARRHSHFSVLVNCGASVVGDADVEGRFAVGSLDRDDKAVLLGRA
jgi:hypothetical protein